MENKPSTPLRRYDRLLSLIARLSIANELSGADVLNEHLRQLSDDELSTLASGNVLHIADVLIKHGSPPLLLAFMALLMLPPKDRMH